MLKMLKTKVQLGTMLGMNSNVLFSFQTGIPAGQKDMLAGHRGILAGQKRYTGCTQRRNSIITVILVAI